MHPPVICSIHGSRRHLHVLPVGRAGSARRRQDGAVIRARRRGATAARHGPVSSGRRHPVTGLLGAPVNARCGTTLLLMARAMGEAADLCVGAGGGRQRVRIGRCVLRDPLPQAVKNAVWPTACNKSVMAQDRSAAPVLANAPLQARLYPHKQRKIASVPAVPSNDVARVRGDRCVLCDRVGLVGVVAAIAYAIRTPHLFGWRCEATRLGRWPRQGDAWGPTPLLRPRRDDQGRWRRGSRHDQHGFGGLASAPAVGARGSSGARDRPQLALCPHGPSRAHERLDRAPTPTPGACPRGVCRPSHRTFPVLSSRGPGKRKTPRNASAVRVAVERGSRRDQGSRKIRWPPSRRQRTAGQRRPLGSVTAVHSQVARPSGPVKLHVISNTPGAFTTALTRSSAGHADASLVSTKRSQAALNARAAPRNFSRSPSESRL